MKLNDTVSYQSAKELTSIALEKGFIQLGSSPEESAENVYKYYKTLFNKFSKGDNDTND